MLHVHLLGDFRVYRDQVPLGSDLGRSGRLLASYLFSFPGRLHRREMLASLFWPDFDHDRARSAMNSAMWRLRKVVAAAHEPDTDRTIRTVGTDIILDQPGWLEIDKQNLEKIVIESLANPRLLGDAGYRCKLSQVLRLHDGPFLGSEDHEWILEERERLQSLYVRGSAILIRQLVMEKAYTEAAEVARRVLRLDPYREQIVRLYVGMLALDDQRVEAVRYFVHWANLLKSELGVGPMPATLQLLNLVKSAASQQDLEGISMHLLSTSFPGPSRD